MRHLSRYWLATCLLTLSHLVQATEMHPTFNREQQLRFETLTHEVRCVVCQSQSVAESDAPLATDLRLKIKKMLLENKSDAEIRHYLVKRYGEFIFLNPKWAKSTIVLWTFPVISLVTGFIILLFRVRFRIRPRGTID